MKKKMISFAAFAALSLSVATAASAATSGVVEKSVNFRSAPSTGSAVYGLLKAGTAFNVLSQPNSYWVQVSVNGQIGYLSTDYIRLNASPPPAGANTGVVEKSVNFRSAPSTGSAVYGLLQTGTVFSVLDQPNSYWVHISVNGQTGYVSTDYIRLNTTSPPPPPPPPQNGSGTESARADRIITHAKNLIGVTKYKFNANTPPTSLDCSSFTKYVFGLEGVTLKWGTKYQKDAGSAVSRDNLQKGDLVFFWTEADAPGSISHVGIYMGAGQFIHNTPSMDGVGISTLTSGYWSQHYVSARRVL